MRYVFDRRGQLIADADCLVLVVSVRMMLAGLVRLCVRCLTCRKPPADESVPMANWPASAASAAR